MIILISFRTIFEKFSWRKLKYFFKGQKLALINKYKRTVIRVQLPDRNVVQGFYLPGVELNEVISNLRRYLRLPEQIELFITPPKKVLNPKENLLDLDLVPAALIYLSSKNQEKSFLNEEISNKVSNATGAEQVLSEGRVLKKDFKSESIESEPVQVSGGSASGSASGSGSGSVMKTDQSAIKRPTTSNSDKSGNTKMPRWFKPSK